MIDKRRSPHRWRSQPLWWRASTGAQYHHGWMIERSAHGAAFLARTDMAPFPDTCIALSTTDPLGPGGDEGQAYVRRVEHVHDDLFLVAAEFRQTIP